MDVQAAADEWVGHLNAHHPDTTVKNYSTSVRIFIEWLNNRGYSTEVKDINRLTIEAFLTYAKKERRSKDRTLRKTYSHLSIFFKWLAEDDDERYGITKNPLSKIKPPKVKPKIVPVPTIEDSLNLLMALDGGNTFFDIRNLAMLYMVFDSGVRAAELQDMKLSKLDFGGRKVHIIGKGDKPRPVRFCGVTATYLQQYLNVRYTHKYSHLDSLWVGRTGALHYSGIRDILITTCARAGITRHHLHQMRHFFAAVWKEQDKSDNGLMNIMGWTTREMVDHYGKWLDANRALDEYDEGMTPIEYLMSQKQPPAVSVDDTHEAEPLESQRRGFQRGHLTLLSSVNQ